MKTKAVVFGRWRHWFCRMILIVICTWSCRTVHLDARCERDRTVGIRVVGLVIFSFIFFQKVVWWGLLLDFLFVRGEWGEGGGDSQRVMHKNCFDGHHWKLFPDLVSMIGIEWSNHVEGCRALRAWKKKPLVGTNVYTHQTKRETCGVEVVVAVDVFMGGMGWTQ